jgi:hypothetical protein
MEEIVCPKCHSNQLTANKKGFNNTNAALGMLTGNAVQGLALGMLGSNKIVITCLKCGNQFKTGDGSIMRTDAIGNESIEKQVFVDRDKIIGRRIALVLIIILIVIVVAIIAFFNSLKSNNDVSNYQEISNASIIATSGANVRQTPSLLSGITDKLLKDERIFVIDGLNNSDIVNGKKGNWYKIRTKNGTEGFIWSAVVLKDEVQQDQEDINPQGVIETTSPKDQNRMNLPFVGKRWYEFEPLNSGTGTTQHYIKISSDGSVYFGEYQQNKADLNDVYENERLVGKFLEVIKFNNEYYKVTGDKIYLVDKTGKTIFKQDCCLTIEEYDNNEKCPCVSELNN